MRKRKTKTRQYAELVIGGRDVVITDPCYLLGDKLWDVANVHGRISPCTVEVDETIMVMADTIYGDWMCELRGTCGGKRHKFGRFTADAGMVCVAQEPPCSWPRLADLPRHCWTRIPKFTGSMRVVYEGGACHIEGEGTSEGRAVRFKSVQVG